MGWMPTPFLVLSRLAHWHGGDLPFNEGIEIRRLTPGEAAAAGSVDLGEYWLCHAFENPYPDRTGRHRKRREAAFKLARHAMYAVQVLVPCGSTGAFQLCRSTPDGWKPESAESHQPLLPTDWARRCVVPATVAADAPAMLERVLEVFHQPILRLQIPIWLLEQGMAAADQHIRLLLLATGLDSLTRASGQGVFKERLCDLLGADTLIFPPDAAGRQPRYRVGDIAGHLYELRNEMAHGLPFQAIFHKKEGLQEVSGGPVGPEFARYRYDKVLEECSLFLLCRALREVLLSRLVFDVHMLEWCVAGVGQPMLS